MASHDTHRPVTTVETTFSLLETIKEKNGARLADVVEEHDLAKSTVQRHLKTLERNGFLVKERGTYHISLRFLDYGVFARNNTPLYRVARPTINDLADETGENVVCMAEENGLGINLCFASGDRSVNISARVGTRSYLHHRAGGKAILAYLPEATVKSIIDNCGLPAITNQTVTDKEELFQELEQIRERGVAFNKHESTEGLHAVGAPILEEGHPSGSISILGPANRLKGEYFAEELPDLLLGAANEIELNLLTTIR